MSALVAVELHRALDDRHDYHRFDAMGKALAHGDALDIAAPSCGTTPMPSCRARRREWPVTNYSGDPACKVSHPTSLVKFMTTHYDSGGASFLYCGSSKRLLLKYYVHLMSRT
ncbi:hypothetical protein DHEL01_v200303 [Diaporthe helianthi]|uniref:Uncharacterized protein n=1 Tax=Diaporthe helianthi TaxID=158607 RepID=A0A2P5IFL6_DIAHE|nr:hypothetical protein DHEL01_v200303 [Diaporthe helianthi]